MDISFWVSGSCCRFHIDLRHVYCLLQIRYQNVEPNFMVQNFLRKYFWKLSKTNKNFLICIYKDLFIIFILWNLSIVFNFVSIYFNWKSIFYLVNFKLGFVLRFFFFLNFIILIYIKKKNIVETSNFLRFLRHKVIIFIRLLLADIFTFLLDCINQTVKFKA